jgi:hypothetical protein
MATSVNSMKSVLRAHNRQVNGCSALPPTLDDSTVVLESAHAVLSLANTALDDNLVNPEILRSAFRATEILLELGLRGVMEGHASLLRGMTRQ